MIRIEGIQIVATRLVAELKLTKTVETSTQFRQTTEAAKKNMGLIETATMIAAAGKRSIGTLSNTRGDNDGSKL
jgi:hypothetical protein